MLNKFIFLEMSEWFESCTSAGRSRSSPLGIHEYIVPATANTTITSTARQFYPTTSPRGGAAAASFPTAPAARESKSSAFGAHQTTSAFGAHQTASAAPSSPAPLMASAFGAASAAPSQRFYFGGGASAAPSSLAPSMASAFGAPQVASAAPSPGGRIGFGQTPQLSLGRGGLCQEGVCPNECWMDLDGWDENLRSAKVKNDTPTRQVFWLLAFTTFSHRDSCGNYVFRINHGPSRVFCSFCQKEFRVSWTERGFEVQTKDVNNSNSHKLDVGHNVPYSAFSDCSDNIERIKKALRRRLRVSRKNRLLQELAEAERSFNWLTQLYGPWGYSSSNCTLMCGECNCRQQNMDNQTYANSIGVNPPVLRPRNYHLILSDNCTMQVTPENEYQVMQEVLRVLQSRV